MTIQFDLHGKGVFITGSAAGLGRHIATAFHELGATVAINDPSGEAVDQAIHEMGGGLRLIAAPGDLARVADVERIVQAAIGELKQLDVLVCVSTAGSICAVDDITEEFWQQALARSAKAAFFTAQACVPALRATRGSIVNVASVVGLVGGPPGAVTYATASGAIVQMTRMMALELAGEGIRVNTFCPAWGEMDSPRDGALMTKYIAERSPLGRGAKPDECAAAVLYLAASLAGCTTGATLVADGGIVSGHYVG